MNDGVKQGGEWWHDSTPGHIRSFSSKSNSRKAASAQIAVVPLALARHIARAFKPGTNGTESRLAPAGAIGVSPTTTQGEKIALSRAIARR